MILRTTLRVDVMWVWSYPYFLSLKIMLNSKQIIANVSPMKHRMTMNMVTPSSTMLIISIGVPSGGIPSNIIIVTMVTL